MESPPSHPSVPDAAPPKKKRFRLRKPTLRGALTNLAILLVTLFVLFLAGEGLVRVIAPAPLEVAPFMFAQDAAKCYTWNASFNGTIRGAAFTTQITTNRDGFRDVEYTTEKLAQPVIMVIGDSVTAAIHVPIEETFAKRLQNELPGYFVMNNGIPGYSPAQELLVLNETIARFKPKIVLLTFFTGNDFIWPEENILEYPCGTMVKDGYLVTTRYDQLGPLYHMRFWLSQNSHLYNFFNKLITNHYGLKKFFYDIGIAITRPYRADLILFDPARHNESEPAYETTFGILREIKTLTATHNATLIVAILPSFDYAVESYWNETVRTYGINESVHFRNMYNRLETFLTTENIAHVDVMQRYTTDPIELYSKNGYYNSNGHAEVGKILGAYLREHGFV